MLIESLLEDLGRKLELKSPTDLHLAASFQGVKEIQVAEMDWAGMLVPTGDGKFVIRVRKHDNPHRRNFTIAHEIAHTFLPGYAVIQHRCGGRSSLGFLGNRHLENLADAGAAELLLPRRFLSPIFESLAFDMGAIKRVAASQHASLDATLRRFLRLTSRDAAVIDLRRSTVPDGSPRTTVHRVFSNSEWCPIAPLQLTGQWLPSSHPLCAIVDSAEASDVIDLSILRTTSRTAHISAISDPYIDNEGSPVMRSLILATPRRAKSVHAISHGRLPEAS